MQYQSECLSALKSVANIHKPFEKAFMDTMKLFKSRNYKQGGNFDWAGNYHTD